MKKILLIIIALLFLSSCATQKNIQLTETFWQQKQHKIAIAAEKPAEPGVTFVGSQGLLDLAINHAMTNKLNIRLKQTDLTWYEHLSNELADKFKEHSINTIIADKETTIDDKKVTSIAAKYSTNEILIVKLKALGVIRRYTGFLPTGAPEAYCLMEGKLIDTTTKQTKWLHLTETKLPIKGNWDQPPTYPNVVSSVKEAISISKQEMMDSLFSGH